MENKNDSRKSYNELFDKKIEDSIKLNMRPINKIVLIDQILEAIGRLIAEGVLKPGDPLPSERDLSEMLGISRTTVSQAVKALDVLGVLEIKPGSRTYLNKSISKLLINPMKFMTLLHKVNNRKLFETREIIEVALTRLAAKNATEEDIERIGLILKKLESCINNQNEFFYCEIDFHDAVFKASDNIVLHAFMASINNLLIDLREKLHTNYGDLQDSFKQHAKIYSYIKKRDVENAGNAMMEHLKISEKLMKKLK